MTVILIIDDEHAIVELLSILLEEEGYKVLTASNGQEGLAQLQKTRPALVLCDLMMPVLSGRDLCQQMKAHPDYQTIPFVIMSAVPGSIMQADGLYSAVIRKPFNLPDVLSVVSRLAPQ